ncbi:MAG: PQQ-dependent sugar dehydrogenase [Pseudanabaenaceae cyanobacterium SKYGB_i_bin29]|nr:PQQ-dependent sugar dehydrogenase [Pseudanabaenaceae cyanobacterium SKYG29]MDW8420661.1 PQQ-dependent sugar dehydrogenase [Pseudanabaenaceae cyanobacterium SKYGB_i_bin29]
MAYLAPLLLLTLLATAQPRIIKNSQDLPQITTVQVTPIVSGLAHPWGMVWLPDGSALITERPGRVRHWQDGRLRLVEGVPPMFAAGQGGLLDIALHPDFPQSSLVYFTYAQGNSSANQTTVARAQFDGKHLRNWQVIWRAQPSKSGTQHFGARLLWLPDRTLLVTVGDGGNPPNSLGGKLIREQAQNRRSHLGKIVRMTADGKVPPDNPFVNDPNSDGFLWTIGHRNIQGLALDPQTREIWAAEHGARGGDELNRLRAGQNYGWPVVSRTREYSTGAPIGKPSAPGMVDPVVVWEEAIAPSGLAVYRGDKFPQWRGNLLVGGLVSQQVQVLNQKGEVIGAIPIGRRVRYVGQGKDGFVYVLTDEPNGQLLRLEP